ncbi:hypothetical protein KIW84_056206 [Lathyrus oleraceus]|uniref:Uncharacterized protein n=1 Tax=Pisum sativum TaxID=3888 RepID=A0A9D4WYP3_PEA|nr:hypothetical protein KIW84_056206 [Pisum sativum]
MFILRGLHRQINDLNVSYKRDTKETYLSLEMVFNFALSEHCDAAYTQALKFCRQHSITKPTTQFQFSKATVHGQLVVDNKSTENVGERVADSCCQVGDYDGAQLEVTENCSNKVKVTTDVGLNNISAEKSALSGTENIPIDSQVMFRTRESKYSAESNHDSHRISDSCELRFKTDCAQSDGIASKEVHTQFDNGCSTHSVPDGDIASGVAGLPTNILMNTESQNITQDLPVSCENNSSVSVPNANEAELHYTKLLGRRLHAHPYGEKTLECGTAAGNDEEPWREKRLARVLGEKLHKKPLALAKEKEDGGRIPVHSSPKDPDPVDSSFLLALRANLSRSKEVIPFPLPQGLIVFFVSPRVLMALHPLPHVTVGTLFPTRNRKRLINPGPYR